ncbi:MAG: alkaline phosphatase [Anaerolineae bacterium]
MKIRTSRRNIIKGGLALMGGTLLFPTLTSSTSTAEPSNAVDELNKVAYMWSGALKATSIRINVCMEDSGVIRLVVRDSAGKEIIMPPTEMIDDENNPNNNHNIATFDVTGLSPDTNYAYWVMMDGAKADRTGHFKTPGFGAYSFKIAFGNCCQTGSESDLFLDMLDKEPLLFIHTGDFHYEDITTDAPNKFRDAYKKVLSSKTQSEFYLNTPIAYMWDDHDYGGDNSDKESASAEAAQNMYRHCVPHHELENDEGGIYHAFTIGRVKFIMTDSRSYRDPAAQPDNDDKSMLGTQQIEWLKQELLNGKFENMLTVWVNTVPWISDKDPDTWAGYATERKEISNFIEANEINNIAMIGGDAHILAIDDGRHNKFGDHRTNLFPVIHAGPLDAYPNYRGGPYSLLAEQRNGHYGIMEINDYGLGLDVEWSGYHFDIQPTSKTNSANNVLNYAFTMSEPGKIIGDNKHKTFIPFAQTSR